MAKLEPHLQTVILCSYQGNCLLSRSSLPDTWFPCTHLSSQNWQKCWSLLFSHILLWGLSRRKAQVGGPSDRCPWASQAVWGQPKLCAGSLSWLIKRFFSQNSWWGAPGVVSSLETSSHEELWGVDEQGLIEPFDLNQKHILFIKSQVWLRGIWPFRGFGGGVFVQGI